MRNLRSVNLNLLPVLRELLRKQNVTHAAQALSMSQPAVSEALGRLRHLLKDEIFIADGRHLRLTSRAERIQRSVEVSLDQIETLFNAEPPDMRAERATIRIATADYVVNAFGPELIAAIAEAAPRLTLHFLDINSNSAADLSTGAIDFMLTPAVSPLDYLERATLFSDRAVCLVSKHSKYGAKLTEEEFWTARHAAFAPGDAVAESIHAIILRTIGNQEFNAVIVQNFLLLPMIVEAADLVAIVPERLARADFVQQHARVAELPFQFPPMGVSVMWHRSKNNEPVHRWVRLKMLELGRATSLQPKAH